jgi:hypothetical protein
MTIEIVEYLEPDESVEEEPYLFKEWIKVLITLLIPD